MSVQLTIEGVPESVRDELSARAALQGLSLQAYLREQLIRIAARPDPGAWTPRARSRARVAGAGVTGQQILEARDADRR
jgi:hypothetical protein